ncbi:outer membrane porin GjpA [[Mycobacterium] holstebronense]|uniref:Outer membrane porin GjpA n=1 Tax=[Mycobacterium] holstebronense TaxID=3064288 RepID=A0ABM9LY70_9MYCO|nr:outer membrane porin GjpA [Mycolicibacter sp. MU0102]CAJ1506769.1 outer membrane porin GjpA [Mycolicibacter sp. MU0102]
MQHFAPAPWVAAGVALIGAGAVAATPVTVPLPGLTATHSAVALTADFDPFGAWQDVFATAKDNASTLWDHMSAVPGVAAQQLIADLMNGTSIDPQAVFEAIVQPNMATDLPMSPLLLSNDALQALVTLVMPQYMPEDFPLTTDELTPILSFLASPLSGVLIGAIGPSIAPLVALGNSVSEISTTLSGDDPDWTAALQDVANIPANMVGGLLNGATLNLDALLPSLTEAGLLPADLDVTALSYTFGGLLSPGVTGTDVEGFINEISDGSSPGIGGSIINGLGLTTGLMGFPLEIEGQGVGLLGAFQSLQEIIAMTLGWDGVGSPLGDEADTIASLVTDIFGISV